MARKKTLSASVDPDVYEQLRRTARESGRSQSAIITSALKLYASLPPAGRRAFDEIIQLAPASSHQEQFLRDLQRALLRSRWEMLAERIDREIGGALPAEVSEDELTGLAEEAIRETRRRRSR
ncbi:MAG: ribbon-helix-helix protein, CopG family [Gemmatimonadota bacterium]